MFPGSCPPVVRPDTDVGVAAEGLGGCRAAVGLRTVKLSQAVPGSLGPQMRGGTRQLWPKWKSETPGGKEPAQGCGTEMRVESHVELDSANELGTPGHGCLPEVPGESPEGQPLDFSPTEGSWGTWPSPPDARPMDGGIVGHSRQVRGDVRQQPLETEVGTEGLYASCSLSLEDPFPCPLTAVASCPISPEVLPDRRVGVSTHRRHTAPSLLVPVTSWGLCAHCPFVPSGSLPPVTPTRTFLTARCFPVHMRTTQDPSDASENPIAGPDADAQGRTAHVEEICVFGRLSTAPESPDPRRHGGHKTETAAVIGVTTVE